MVDPSGGKRAPRPYESDANYVETSMRTTGQHPQGCSPNAVSSDCCSVWYPLRPVGHALVCKAQVSALLSFTFIAPTW